MKHFKVITLVVITSLFLIGCQTPGGLSKQTGGAVLGGALGGLAGSQVGGGRGRTAATIGGTILGAMLGGAVGASMDETDRMKTTYALENNPTNQSTSWRNPDNNASYTVTPVRTYQGNDGSNCREYSTVGVINGKKETIVGNACRQPDGSWRSI